MFSNSRNEVINKQKDFFLKFLLFSIFSSQQNGDSNENDTKHTFPHVYKLPQFADTLRLALASQDASAFKLRTYYRNLLISSIYDDLTRTYNLWYFILKKNKNSFF